jgi:hypothetical protein
MERLRFRTLGEILYELMTGLLFYPRTLWRVLLQPTQIADATGEPAADLVSPPLFLLVSILAAHGLDLAMGSELGETARAFDLAPLLLRGLAFSLLPLVLAAGVLRREGRPVNHATLRTPFDLQCFYAAPLAISVSVAAVLLRAPSPAVRLAGVLLGLGAAAWHLCVQTRWIRARLAVSRFRALRTALWLTGVALFFCLLSTPLIFDLAG